MYLSITNKKSQKKPKQTEKKQERKNTGPEINYIQENLM